MCCEKKGKLISIVERETLKHKTKVKDHLFVSIIKKI